MTTFINKKEEVIEIQLTPYGKHLFSQGDFNPEYYSFFDDDILYDGSYGGIEESQNSIVSRIKETERLSLYENFSGSVQNNVSISVVPPQAFETLTDFNAKFFKTIGNNSPWSDYYPAWQVQTLSGSTLFKSFNGELVTYESEHSLPIINSTLTLNYSGSYEQIIYDEEEVPYLFYNVQEQDRLLLDIQELNTIFKVGGNYDIDIFKFPRPIDGLPAKEYQRLEFIDRSSPYYELLQEQVNDPYSMAFLQTERNIETFYPVIDQTYVDYYLSVRVDDEISEIEPFTNNLYNTGRNNNSQEPCD